MTFRHSGRLFRFKLRPEQPRLPRAPQQSRNLEVAHLRGGEQLDLEEHVSPGRSFKLVLALAIGVAVFACVAYFMLGGKLPPRTTTKRNSLMPLAR
jgi:hypothetical protein